MKILENTSEIFAAHSYEVFGDSILLENVVFELSRTH